MKITKIFNIAPKAIQIELDNGEWAKLWDWGKTIYTQTSDKVKKSTLVELKKDAQLFEWEASKLEQLYINNK